MTIIQSKLVYEPGRRLGYQGPRSSTHVGPVHCDKFARTTLTDLNILQLKQTNVRIDMDDVVHQSQTSLASILAPSN